MDSCCYPQSRQKEVCQLSSSAACGEKEAKKDSLLLDLLKKRVLPFLVLFDNDYGIKYWDERKA